VLPALRSLANVEVVALASRTASSAQLAPGLRVFADYQSALLESEADLAYVSTVNSEHARWAMRCLDAGLHVVVDKPACLSVDEARSLLDRATSKGRCVAEATVFPFHPQFEALRRRFNEENARLDRVMAAFSFPPLDPDDFRYRRDLGGGALNDLGPYVAATSRILFGSPPHSVHCEVDRRANGVETAFSVLLSYPSHGALVGHFGFDTEYQNRLLAFGPELAVELQRAFTLPADVPAQLATRRKNKEAIEKIGPSDMFANFLQAVIAAIEAENWDSFGSALINDAQLVDQLRRATGEH